MSFSTFSLTKTSKKKLCFARSEPKKNPRSEPEPETSGPTKKPKNKVENDVGGLQQQGEQLPEQQEEVENDGDGLLQQGEQKTDYDEERLIDTDAGEECDDEFTLIEECCHAALNQKIMLKVMFTDKHGQQEIDKFIKLCGGKDFSELPNIEFSIPNIEKCTPINRRLSDRTTARKYSLLQIGPNTDEVQTKLLNYYDGATYNYVLLGMPGTTNSKKAFKKLWNGANDRYILDTANGDGAFKFNMSAITRRMMEKEIKDAFGKTRQGRIQRALCKNRMKEHVARIGFRNLCGRANAIFIPGKFIAHLIAADTRGANFQTAFGVAQKMFPSIVTDDIQGSVQSMLLNMPELNNEIDAVVETYVELMKNNGLIFGTDGLSNGGRVQVTQKQIKDGYGFILKVCHIAFGVPIAFFVSGSPGKWEPQWFDGKFKQLSDGEYARTDDALDKAMATAFENWLIEIETKNIDTSPAYDVVGGRFSRGVSQEHFDKEAYFKEDMNMGWKVTMMKDQLTL